MGKHSLEKEKSNKKTVIICFVIAIVLIICGTLALKENENKPTKQNEMTGHITDLKTVENTKLVIKSTNEYNKVIEYSFKQNKVKNVKIFEEFEQKEEYENRKKNYELNPKINIINSDDEKLFLEIEKLDLGTDEGLTYEEIYDKYINQIIGSYEVVE